MPRVLLVTFTVLIGASALMGCRVEGEVDDDLTTPITVPR
jgi:hypothetical protein